MKSGVVQTGPRARASLRRDRVSEKVLSNHAERSPRMSGAHRVARPDQLSVRETVRLLRRGMKTRLSLPPARHVLAGRQRHRLPPSSHGADRRPEDRCLAILRDFPALQPETHTGRGRGVRGTSTLLVAESVSEAGRKPPTEPYDGQSRFAKLQSLVAVPAIRLH